MGKEYVQGDIEAMLSRSSSSSSDSSLSTFSLSSNSDNSNATKELPLLALNHVSYVCNSVSESAKFYVDVLGFMLIKRPSSFNFHGAWLFNHGIGIHLLENENVSQRKGKINPKDNHISFQCTNMELIMQKLEEMNIEYVTAEVKEGGVIVDQLFFHDPDGYMIEICNCQNLPVLPLSTVACPLNKHSWVPTTNQPISSSNHGNKVQRVVCSGEVEALMMENLTLDMINLSF